METLVGTSNDETGRKVAAWYASKMKYSLPEPPYSVICWFRGTNPVACAIFNGYNKSSVNLHFYGPGCVTRQVIRTIVDYVFNQLHCNVMIATIRRSHNFKYVLPRTGFKYVAVIPSYFGPDKKDDGIIYYFHRSLVSKWIKDNGQRSDTPTAISRPAG